MNRPKSLGGHRSQGSLTIMGRHVMGRNRTFSKYNQARRYSDASVLVGKTHSPHPLRRGNRVRILTYHNTPHVHPSTNTHTHKRPNLPGNAERRNKGELTSTQAHKDGGAESLPNPHDIHTQDWGWLNKQHTPSPTGVIDTNLPTNTYTLPTYETAPRPSATTPYRCLQHLPALF